VQALRNRRAAGTTRAPMIRKTIYAFSKRAFLNPASTHLTSYIQAHIQTDHEGPDKWGDNRVIIADCKRVVELEFFLGSKRDRRISLAKIDLLIKVLMQFRRALAKEISLIEGGESNKPRMNADKRGSA
jgi:hypothetical protein